MRALIVAALLFAGSCNSARGEELVTANTVGGWIVLLDKPCSDPELGNLAASFNSEMEITRGCWQSFDGDYLIVWESGDLGTYPQRLFYRPLSWQRPLEEIRGL